MAARQSCDDKREAPYCNLICPFNGDGPVEGAKWIQRVSDRLDQVEKEMKQFETIKSDIDGLKKTVNIWQGIQSFLVGAIGLCWILIQISSWIKK